MASEAKILEAIFGPSIPLEKAAVLPEIMGHIRAIDDLLQGKTMRQARKRISDPAISGPINRRIEELYAEISRDRPDIAGKIWPKIAAAISQGFGVTISPDACRGRYKDAMERKAAAIMQQEGYAALSGEAIQAGTYTTPPEVLQLATKEKPAEPAVDPTPGEQADKSDAPSEKVLPPEPPAEPPTQSAIIQERPAPQSLTRAELDAKMWALHMAGKTPEEISDALYSEGLYYSEKSVRVRLISQGAML